VDEDITKRQVARRRLLYRASAVAATVAGAGAASAAMGSPAAAAVGDPVLAGQSNSAGSANTKLGNNSNTNPTLSLANPAQTNDSGFLRGGPALRLEPNGDYVEGPVGSLGVSADGTLWTSVPWQGGVAADFVRTGSNSNIVVSFPSFRVLDTRPEESQGKTGIMNPGVIDSAGNLKGGETLHVSLDSLLVWGWTIFGNITVLAGSRQGRLLAWPAGESRPSEGNNLVYPANGRLGNFAAISVGSIAVGSKIADNAISVWVNTPAKVVIDVTAAVVNYPSDVIGFSSGFSANARGGTARTRPAHLTPPRS
jgi:hypothetical protein